MPDDVAASDLDGDTRRDLLTLDKANAESVARHLVMVSQLLYEEPALALEHARAARRRASRVGVVRETAGIAAYNAGEWQEAISELRAARRITGGTELLPLIADAERGLGRPDRAIEIARSDEGRALRGDEATEMRLVEAGARIDLGEPEKALVTLQLEDLTPSRVGTEAARLFYAYASALEAAGRVDDASTWYMNAAAADVDDATDAEFRLMELSGPAIDAETDYETDNETASAAAEDTAPASSTADDAPVKPGANAAPTAAPATEAIATNHDEPRAAKPATVTDTAAESPTAESPTSARPESADTQSKAPSETAVATEAAVTESTINEDSVEAESSTATSTASAVAVEDAAREAESAPAASAESDATPVAAEPTSLTLVSGYDALLLDLDGTVFAGSSPVPGAVETLDSLDVTTVFVTNNARRRPAEVAEHLRSMGFTATPEQVVTSAQTAARLLAEHLDPGSRALVLGTEGLVQEVREVGIAVTRSADDRPLAVIQGFSPDTGWEQLCEATLAIRAGALWVATNIDATLPSERGLLVGNGSLVAAVANATGQEPLVAGKPAAPLMADAIARSKAEVPLVVGDRLDTDIQGAHAVGLDSLLVLTGVSGPGDLLSAPPENRPTYVAAGLEGLNEPMASSKIEERSEWAVSVDGNTVTVRPAEGSGNQATLLPALAAAVWRLADAGEVDLNELVVSSPDKATCATLEALGLVDAR